MHRSLNGENRQAREATRKQKIIAMKSLNVVQPSKLLQASNMFALLAGLQVLVWVSVDPASAPLMGLSSKYISSTAILRFAILNMIMFSVLRFSENVPVLKLCSEAPKSLSQLHGKLLFVFALYLIGFFAVSSPVVFDMGGYVNRALSEGTFATEALQTEDSFFGTLTNLGPLLAAFFSAIVFSNGSERSSNRRYVIMLVIVLLCSAFEGFFLSRRIQFFLCALALAVSMMLVKNVRIRIPVIFFAIVGCFLGILAFEMSRYGLQNATRHAIPLFSFENIYMTAQYLLSAYFYSDVNNAMVILGNPSDYSLVFGASDLISTPVWSLFGIDSTSFNYLNDWTSAYGTINVFGIWWASAGWISITYVVTLGVIAGSLWNGISSGESRNLFGVVLYTMLLIGIVNDLRINYFMLTKFLVPMTAFLFLQGVVQKRKTLTRCQASSLLLKEDQCEENREQNEK